MPRRSDDHILQVQLTTDEIAALAQIRAHGLFSSDANVVRSALWSLGTEMGLDFASGVFDQRSMANRKKAVKAPRKPWKRPKTAEPKSARPSDDHPWRASVFKESL